MLRKEATFARGASHCTECSQCTAQHPTASRVNRGESHRTRNQRPTAHTPRGIPLHRVLTAHRAAFYRVTLDSAAQEITVPPNTVAQVIPLHEEASGARRVPRSVAPRRAAQGSVRPHKEPASHCTHHAASHCTRKQQGPAVHPAASHTAQRGRLPTPIIPRSGARSRQRGSVPHHPHLVLSARACVEHTTQQGCRASPPATCSQYVAGATPPPPLHWRGSPTTCFRRACMCGAHVYNHAVGRTHHVPAGTRGEFDHHSLGRVYPRGWANARELDPHALEKLLTVKLP